jgi:hypothetical protein
MYAEAVAIAYNASWRGFFKAENCSTFLNQFFHIFRTGKPPNKMGNYSVCPYIFVCPYILRKGSTIQIKKCCLACFRMLLSQFCLP